MKKDVWYFLERDCRDKQKTVDELKDSVDMQRRDLDSMRKEIFEKDVLCSALKVRNLIGRHGDEGCFPESVPHCEHFAFNMISQKQMSYLEAQHGNAQAAKDEARRLRTKIKTFEK